jgi:hypothetical protein
MMWSRARGRSSGDRETFDWVDVVYISMKRGGIRFVWRGCCFEYGICDQRFPTHDGKLTNESRERSREPCRWATAGVPDAGVSTANKTARENSREQERQRRGLWERQPFVAARQRLGLTGVDDRTVAGGAGVAIVPSEQVFDESVNS